MLRTATNTFSSRLLPLAIQGAIPVALLVALSSCVVVVGADGWDWDGGRRSVRASGHIVEETRTVTGFHAIELDTFADVRVQVGEETGIHVRGDDNLLPHLVTRVKNGVLHVDLEGIRARGGSIEVTVETPNLDAFEIDGSGSVSIEGLSGSKFLASIDGSGTMHAAGEVDVLHADIDGSGDLRLQHLRAREASVDIDGSGNVHVHASALLEYDIDGAGDITYSGDPRVRGDIDGAGNVRADR